MIKTIKHTHQYLQGVYKNFLESGAHKWIYLIDAVAGIGTRLYIDFLFLTVQVLILKMKKAYYTCIV